MNNILRKCHFLKMTWVVGVFALLPACTDKDYDLSNDLESDITLFSNYLILPLGQDKIQINEQIGDIEGIVKDPITGEYSFSKGESLEMAVDDEKIGFSDAIQVEFSLKADDVFKESGDFYVPEGDYVLPKINEKFDFKPSKEVVRLDSIHFSKDSKNKLAITINPTKIGGALNSNGMVTLSLPDFFISSTDENIDIKNGGHEVILKNINLSQKTTSYIYLDKAVFENGYSNLSYSVSAKIYSDGSLTYTDGAALDISLKLHEINFDDVWGIFDIDVAQSEAYEFDMSDIWEYFTEDEDVLDFYQPFIEIKSQSNVSIPLKVSVKAEALNGKTSIPAENYSFTINVKDGYEKIEESDLNLNKLLSVKPNSLKLTTSVKPITDGQQHHIQKNPKGIFDYNIDIPFKFGPSMSIAFEEEVEDVFDEDAIDLLFRKGTAGLLLDIENTMPVAATLKIQFLNVNGSVVKEIVSDKEIVANGTTEDIKLEFDSKDVQDAKNLRFLLRMKSNSNNVPESIKDGDYIGLKIKLYKKDGGITL